MARYHLYYLRDNQLVGADEIEAADDRDAEQIAMTRSGGKTVEIWNAHKRVNVVTTAAQPGPAARNRVGAVSADPAPS